jgi:hypothetical protein
LTYREAAIQAYQDKSEGDLDADYEVLEMLVDIIDAYISKESASQVNISSVVSKHIFEEVEEFELKIEEAFSKKQASDLNENSKDSVTPTGSEHAKEGAGSHHSSDESLVSEQSSAGELEVARTSADTPAPPRKSKHKRLQSNVTSASDSTSTIEVTVPMTPIDHTSLNNSARRFRKNNASKKLTNPTWQDFVAEQKLLKASVVSGINSTQVDCEVKNAPSTELRNSESLGNSQSEELSISESAGGRHKRTNSKNVLMGQRSTVGGLDSKKLSRKTSRQNILRQHPIVTVFDKALMEIFELMRTDSYVRFRHSEQYKQFVKKIIAEADQKQVMRDLKLIS